MVPDFFPFPGLRYRTNPHSARLDQLTAPPYDVIDAEARARLEAAHPKNAVHLILPRDRDGEDCYQQAAGLFRQWRAENVLAPDPPSFYIYRMGFRDDAGAHRRMLGVIGALALSPPGEGNVRPHERTMSKPKGDRLSLLAAVRANLDPVWCLSLGRGLSGLLEPEGPPACSCVDEAGVEHCLFPVRSPELTAAIAASVGGSPVVIADGHHRFETALAYQADHPGDVGAGRIMTMVVELAADQLSVRPIHRLLHDAGRGLRARLSPTAEVEPAGPNTPEGVRRLTAEMRSAGGLGLIDGEGLALVTPHRAALGPRLAHLHEAVREVDSARLDALLELAGFDGTLAYQHDATSVAAAVAKGTADAAVLLRPPAVAQIQSAAAAGVRMPEKTTFFHPKPLTGMVFRSLDP